MMIDPVSSTEVVLRLIQDRQTVGYVGISAMIITTAGSKYSGGK